MLSDHGLRRVKRRSSTAFVVTTLVIVMGMAGPVSAAPIRALPAEARHALPAGLAAEDPAPPAPLTPAEQASKAALATGERVEVVAERAESELVFANPDGTFTSEITAGPQRVQRPDGSWTDVDTSLERRADGSIGPRASTVDLTFFADGSKDLVRLGAGGKSMTLSWPTALPRPVIDGPDAGYATYPEVLPGVDLKVRASDVGYRHVLVVKDAEAANNAQLSQLKLSVRGEGVEVREGSGGGIDAVDGSGNTVFSGAEPTMWDSSGPTDAAALGEGTASTSSAAKRNQSVGNSGSTPVAGPGVGDISAAPGPTSRVAQVGLSLTDGALTLVPDAELLRGPDTVYPVYIDPDAGATIAKTDYLYVSSDRPSTEYHNFDDEAGVGRCSSWGGDYCALDYYTNRMYFKFKPVESQWDERVVKDVTFSAYETWSFSCTATWVNLRLVDEDKVNSKTNWNNRPDPDNKADLMGDRHVAYGRGKSCDPDAPAAFVEFSDNKEESNENLTKTVAGRLASGKQFAFSLTAADETDGNGWKRFNGSKSKLTVTYNSRPSKPFGEKTTDPSTSCVSGAGHPYVWNQKQPTLVVNAKDADSENISVNFYMKDTKTGAEFTKTVGPKAHTDSKNDPVDFKAVPTLPFLHGHTYRWHARSDDGKLESLLWSDWCEYSVDLERPNAVPAVTSADFPTDSATRKPGELGKVSFSANGNSDSAFGNDVEYYEWAVGNDNPTNKTYPSVLGGEAEESKVAAVAFGPNVLYVRSVDQAGNRGAVATYVFSAVRPCEDPAADSCAAAAYLLDEATGATAADSSGKGRTLTLSGVERVDGQRKASEAGDRALRFAGGADYATAPSVVDTRNGFTVMAWVKPLSLTGDATVISQVGTYGNGFALSYSAALKRWTFTRHKADMANPTAGDVVQAVDGNIEAPAVGAWTHVVGMFNPGNNRMSIYIDGQEQGTADYTGTVWNATSGLQLGRSRLNDKWVNAFSGDIDDVRVFPGGLDPADIRALWRNSKP